MIGTSQIPRLNMLRHSRERPDGLIDGEVPGIGRTSTQTCGERRLWPSGKVRPPQRRASDIDGWLISHNGSRRVRGVDQPPPDAELGAA